MAKTTPVPRTALSLSEARIADTPPLSTTRVLESTRASASGGPQQSQPGHSYSGFARRHAEIRRSNVAMISRGPRRQVVVRGAKSWEQQSCPLPAPIGEDEYPAGYYFHTSARLCFTNRPQSAIKWFCRSNHAGTMATLPTSSTPTARQNHGPPNRRLNLHL